MVIAPLRQIQLESNTCLANASLMDACEFARIRHMVELNSTAETPPPEMLSPGRTAQDPDKNINTGEGQNRNRTNNTTKYHDLGVFIRFPPQFLVSSSWAAFESVASKGLGCILWHCHVGAPVVRKSALTDLTRASLHTFEHFYHGRYTPASCGDHHKRYYGAVLQFRRIFKADSTPVPLITPPSFHGPLEWESHIAVPDSVQIMHCRRSLQTRTQISPAQGSDSSKEIRSHINTAHDSTERVAELEEISTVLRALSTSASREHRTRPTSETDQDVPPPPAEDGSVNPASQIRLGFK
ncbi:hypothetical protein B0H13DRAFT_2279270 [Mycena leptocephala]|nr:hypothetical protein B0H13DRAFT_2279270 [Mycena leptocephala]